MSVEQLNAWARQLRLNERETAIETFRLVMQGRQFRHRHVDDAGDEIVESVLAFYARIEGAVSAPERPET